MIGLDTNVLVRFVTEDDERQSPAAVQFIEQQLHPSAPGYISLVTLAELAWVLRSRHKASTAEVAVVVQELASDLRFRLQDENAVWLALEMVDRVAADFPDALVAAVDRLHGCTHTITFDTEAARLPGVRLLEA